MNEKREESDLRWQNPPPTPHHLDERWEAAAARRRSRSRLTAASKTPHCMQPRRRRKSFLAHLTRSRPKTYFSSSVIFFFFCFPHDCALHWHIRSYARTKKPRYMRSRNLHFFFFFVVGNAESRRWRRQQPPVPGTKRMKAFWQQRQPKQRAQRRAKSMGPANDGELAKTSLRIPPQSLYRFRLNAYTGAQQSVHAADPWVVGGAPLETTPIRAQKRKDTRHHNNIKEDGKHSLGQGTSGA